MIAASGTPRAAAAFRRCVRRVGAAVLTPVDAFAGVLCAVESALPDITAIAGSPGPHVSRRVAGNSRRPGAGLRVAVAGCLGGGSARAGTAVSTGRLGNQPLMDLM